MTVHHIITSEHQKKICPYCKSSIEKEWESEFPENKHYKKVECKCGKIIRIAVDFIGTGHDSFNKEKQTKLDARIEQAEKDQKQ